VDQILNDLETRRNASSVLFCAENRCRRYYTSSELPQLDNEEEEKENQKNRSFILLL